MNTESIEYEFGCKKFAGTEAWITHDVEFDIGRMSIQMSQVHPCGAHVNGFILYDKEGRERIWIGKTNDRTIPLHHVEVGKD